MVDADRALSAQAIVEECLFDTSSEDFKSRLDWMCPFQRNGDGYLTKGEKPSSKLMAVSQPILNARERKELVRQCKKLRTQLGEENFVEAEQSSSHQQKESLKTKYKSWKRAIRYSAAAQIQAVWKGYSARRPLFRHHFPWARGGILRLCQALLRDRFLKNRRTPASQWGKSTLAEEKKFLKVSLSAVDKAMQKQLGRSLSKADKESYRPLYDRYHRLKDALGGKKSVFAFSGATSSSFPSYAAAAASSQDGHAGQGGTVKASQGLGAVVSLADAGSFAWLDQQLQPLKKEKRRLQMSLNKFEKDFLATRRRPVQFASDVAPVQDQFVRYKQLKRQIATLESQLVQRARLLPKDSGNTSSRSGIVPDASIVHQSPVTSPSVSPLVSPHLSPRVMASSETSSPSFATVVAPTHDANQNNQNILSKRKNNKPKKAAGARRQNKEVQPGNGYSPKSGEERGTTRIHGKRNSRRNETRHQVLGWLDASSPSRRHGLDSGEKIPANGSRPAFSSSADHNPGSVNPGSAVLNLTFPSSRSAKELGDLGLGVEAVRSARRNGYESSKSRQRQRPRSASSSPSVSSRQHQSHSSKQSPSSLAYSSYASAASRIYAAGAQVGASKGRR